MYIISLAAHFAVNKIKTILASVLLQSDIYQVDSFSIKILFSVSLLIEKVQKNFFWISKDKIRDYSIRKHQLGVVKKDKDKNK